MDAFGSLFLPRLATAAIVLAVAGGGWLGWAHWYGQPVFTADYATERGQRLAVDLPDGSALLLDTATRIEVRLYRKRREVHLADGQVMFDVAGDGARPFAVLAGAARVTVVGTRFSVRHTQAGLAAGQTVVAVESGTVRVAGDRLLPSGTAGVALTAGQGVSAGRGGQLAPVVSFPAEGVGAWRNSRVSFDDTPLADALAEFERYEDTGLVVRDPRVGALRLGGSFDLRQARTFAQTLPLMLPVRLEQRGTETEIVALDQAD
ncbi:iron dicitrate transport regulator FecR [Pseudothauera nasutitermitis]|uniref:Iron dicitrate transport regulator FecR n=1 Tax=Pseudothauera nasutitermitis TaxID=2565930 RepID=A0A4S4B4E7_9RHOO|nr:iron dicitrate transport regulator FecR [Pseudothauera nasutitermitis]